MDGLEYDDLTTWRPGARSLEKRKWRRGVRGSGVLPYLCFGDPCSLVGRRYLPATNERRRSRQRSLLVGGALLTESGDDLALLLWNGLQELSFTIGVPRASGCCSCLDGKMRWLLLSRRSD